MLLRSALQFDAMSQKPTRVKKDIPQPDGPSKSPRRAKREGEEQKLIATSSEERDPQPDLARDRQPKPDAARAAKREEDNGDDAVTAKQRSTSAE